MLQPPLSHGEIVDRYSLTSIKSQPVDIKFDESQNLITSRGRGLLFGTRAQDAMWVFVSAWRLNAPAMRLMLEASRELRGQESEHDDREEEALANAWPDGERPTPEGLTNIQAALDISGSAVLGRGALAGSVMIMAASLLNELKENLQPNKDEWPVALAEGCRPTIAQIIIAAANSFRHQDEWRAAISQNEINNQQKRSMDILLSVFENNPAQVFLEKINASEKALMLLAEGDFDAFERAVLSYANDVAERVASRT